MASGFIPKIRGINEVRVLSSADDLNNLVNTSDTGFYYITTQPSNCPTTWSMMQNFSMGGSGIISQVIFGSESIYIRRRAGTPATWSSWYKFTGSVVD